MTQNPFETETLIAPLRPPLLFIFGCGRSGTTLLQLMFDSHPEMAVAFNSRFLLDLAGLRDRYESADGFASELFIRELLADEGFGRWGLPETSVRLAFAERPPPTLADAVRLLFGLYAAREGKSRCGNKTNRVAFYVSRVAAFLPEARFVHLMRDGRNVALAYGDSEWGEETSKKAARKWKYRVEAGLRNGRPLGPARYREIKYEDLIDDPERSLRSLCEFADLEFDPSMLNYTGRAESLLSTFANPHEHASLRRPPTKGLRNWRTQMDSVAVREFEAVAGDLLSALGYETLASGPR